MSLDHESQSASHPSDEPECQLNALAQAAPKANTEIDLNNIVDSLAYCIGAISGAATLCFDGEKPQDVGSILRFIQAEVTRIHEALDEHATKIGHAVHLRNAFEDMVHSEGNLHA